MNVFRQSSFRLACRSGREHHWYHVLFCFAIFVKKFTCLAASFDSPLATFDLFFFWLPGRWCCSKRCSKSWNSRLVSCKVLGSQVRYWCSCYNTQSRPGMKSLLVCFQVAVVAALGTHGQKNDSIFVLLSLQVRFWYDGYVRTISTWAGLSNKPKDNYNKCVKYKEPVGSLSKIWLMVLNAGKLFWYFGLPPWFVEKSSCLFSLVRPQCLKKI